MIVKNGSTNHRLIFVIIAVQESTQPFALRYVNQRTNLKFGELVFFSFHIGHIFPSSLTQYTQYAPLADVPCSLLATFAAPHFVLLKCMFIIRRVYHADVLDRT